MRSALAGVLGVALAGQAPWAVAQERAPMPPTPPGAYAGALPDGPALAEDWITAFNQPWLDALVREALAGNPDLAGAQARADAARARADATFGRLLPDLNLRLGGGRTEAPDGLGGRSAADVATAGLSAGWEADVWGRLRAQSRAGRASARAAEADYAFARLSIAGQTARAAFDLIEAEQLRALAAEDLSLRERALTLTERRFDSGVVGALSLRTARSQVASSRAAAAQATEGRRAAARRLEELLGRYPGGAIAPGASLPQLGPLAAPGAPAALLAARPDLAAAEARLAAAGFEARAARAALWPQLSFSASADGSARRLSDALDPDAAVTNLLANLAAPLFQGGALRANARAARADSRAAAAAYVEASLRAWREVEGALTADRTLDVRAQELDTAAREARAAQELAEREYGRGLISVFDLIDAISRRIDAERGLITVRAEQARNQVDYHIALGAGAERGGLAPAAPLPEPTP